MTTAGLYLDDVIRIADDVRDDIADWSSMPGAERPELIQRPSGPNSWLRVRHAYFNASAAATLYGEHPFQTLTGVVHTKLAPFGGPGVDNPATRRGRHLEPAIANWWAEEHHLDLYEPTVLYAAFPLLATLDRRIVGRNREAVEIKTTSHVVTEPAPYWVWQVQAQMACAELDRVHLAVLDAHDAAADVHRRARRHRDR